MGEYMAGDELVSFWDGWLSDNHMQGLNREQLIRAAYVIRAIERLQLDRPSILDIGCAHGWVSRRLLEFGPVTGVDMSEVAIADAKEQIPEGEFHAGDFLELGLPAEHYDVIVCLESIAYMDQPAFVSEAARLLRPSGHLIVTTPNWPVWENKGRGRASPSTLHARHLDMETLTDLLSAEFDMVTTTTLCPQGIARFLDSRKVNKALSVAVSETRLLDLKGTVGRLGRGGTLFALGRKQQRTTP